MDVGKDWLDLVFGFEGTVNLIDKMYRLSLVAVVFYIKGFGGQNPCGQPRAA